MFTPHRIREWQEFKVWCVKRKLKPLPAHPWTLAAYIRWLDANRRYRSMFKRIEIIARVHVMACLKSPDKDQMVQRTLSAIEERRQPVGQGIFDGHELLAPKTKHSSKPDATAKRLMSNTPKLVRRRPQLES